MKIQSEHLSSLRLKDAELYIDTLVVRKDELQSKLDAQTEESKRKMTQVCEVLDKERELSANLQSKLEAALAEIEIIKLKQNLVLTPLKDDGAELSCQFIDGVIKKYPDTTATMERIRSINLQLRYDFNGYKELYDNVLKENEKLKVKHGEFK